MKIINENGPRVDAGPDLLILYMKLFANDPTKTGPDAEAERTAVRERIKKFQHCAANASMNDAGMTGFKTWVAREFFDGNVPQFSDQHWEALVVCMRYDQNCRALRPWSPNTGGKDLFDW